MKPIVTDHVLILNSTYANSESQVVHLRFFQRKLANTLVHNIMFTCVKLRDTIGNNMIYSSNIDTVSLVFRILIS